MSILYYLTYFYIENLYLLPYLFNSKFEIELLGDAFNKMKGNRVLSVTEYQLLLCKAL